MADVSKIKLPDNTEVNIKDSRISGIDSVPTSGSENLITSGGVFDSLRTDKIKPIESHTYSNVLATTSNYNTLFPLFRVIPTVWDEPVVVVYRMKVYVSGHEDLYYSKHECAFSFFHDALLAYSLNNLIGSTSYRTIYYNSAMRCYSAYKSIGHLIGFNYYSNGTSYSRNCTTSGYGRTFEVEILVEDNCTIAWLDSCGTVSSAIVSGYVAETTHTSVGNYNATTQGETHSGDANTNTIAYYMRNCTIDLPMSAQMYRYRMVFMSADGTKWVPANTSTSTNATAIRDVIQTPINPFGQIGYYYTTTVVAAGAKPGSGNIWRQYEVTLGYSFNRTGAALVLTFPAPIYLKCAPQSDGSAIIDADTPYVQTLPSSADGKIYIYLGVAYNATQIVLTIDHPIYYHDGTGIRLWTGGAAGDVNVIETVKVNGTALSPDANKAVNVPVPTTLDDINDGSTRKLSDYLPLSGGPMADDAAIYLNDCENDFYRYTTVGGGFIELEDDNGKITDYGIDGISSIVGTYTFPSKSGTFAMTSDIPAAVTESTVSGWGFTKNAGTLTGVSFNGSSATVTNGVAAINATIPEDKIFVVEFTIEPGEEEGEFEVSTTTTFSEIAAAVQAGKFVVGTAASNILTLTDYEPGSFFLFNIFTSYSSNDDFYLSNGQIYVGSEDEVGLRWHDVFIPPAPGTLDTTATTAQSTSASEALSGNITLHKVAKTGTYSDLIGTPTIPTVPTISTNVVTDKNSDTKTSSPKSVYDEIHPAIVTTQPVGGFVPNVLYNLGTLTGSVTFALATPADSSVVNHYYWTFDTGSTAPTITWPVGITKWNGDSAPEIVADAHYEVSVLGGIGAFIKA